MRRSSIGRTFRRQVQYFCIPDASIWHTFYLTHLNLWGRAPPQWWERVKVFFIFLFVVILLRSPKAEWIDRQKCRPGGELMTTESNARAMTFSTGGHVGGLRVPFWGQHFPLWNAFENCKTPYLEPPTCSSARLILRGLIVVFISDRTKVFCRSDNRNLIYYARKRVAIVDSHSLDVCARRISTVGCSCSRLRTKNSSMAATNRKWFPGTVPRVSDVICRWMHIVWGRPSRFRPLDTSGTTPKNHFRSAYATAKKRLKATNPTSNSQNSSKNPDRCTAYRSELPPLVWATTLANGRKWLDHHPWR